MDYQFSYDEERKLMTVIQNGYWSMETFRGFEAGLLDWHRQVSALDSQYRILADCTDFLVQSVEVGEAFRVLFEQFMTDFHGRYAVIVGTTMNKLQARRLLSFANLRVFTKDERKQAEAWLFDQGNIS